MREILRVRKPAKSEWGLVLALVGDWIWCRRLGLVSTGAVWSRLELLGTQASSQVVVVTKAG
jgi:hypothetical protein